MSNYFERQAFLAPLNVEACSPRSNAYPVRPTFGAYDPSRDICTICQQTLDARDPTYTQIGACNQSYHRAPCYEDICINVLLHTGFPFRCPYCRECIGGPQPYQVIVSIVPKEQNLGWMKKKIGEERFAAKPLEERKVGVIKAAELIDRIMPPDTQEMFDAMFDASFGVTDWAVYKFPKHPVIELLYVPNEAVADPVTRTANLAHWKGVQRLQADSDAQKRAEDEPPSGSKGFIRQLVSDLKQGYKIAKETRNAR